MQVAADGSVTIVRPLANPRFNEPYGGRYWRIDFAAPGTTAPREPLRSRALWDADIDPAAPVGPVRHCA